MSESYGDLNDLPNLAEELGDEGLESKDYSDFEVTPVGNYVSEAREIKFKRSKKGGISFEIVFSSGLKDPATGRTYARPDKTWISTTRFQKANRPGSTSGVAEYLRAVGLDPKGTGDIKQALQESQVMPVQVWVSWEDKAVNEGTQDSPNWVSKGLKTKDFNQGTKAEPHYVPNVTIDGHTFTARARANGFSKVPA